MIDDELQTQAALYALGALPADEASAFEERLAGDPELAAFVAEYEAVSAAIAESVHIAATPPHLRGNVLSAVAQKPAAIESPRTAWIPWALAAGLAFAAGVLWVQNDRLRTVNRGQLADWTRLNAELQNARNDSAKNAQMLSAVSGQLDRLRAVNGDKTARIASLQRTISGLQKRNELAEMQVATLTSKLDASYLASIAWDRNRQEGILHVRRLPETANGKDYQLWVIDPKYSAPISAGVFKVQPDGSATITFSPAQKISDATAFAVSLEKSGGSDSPEGPVMLSN